MAIHKVTANQNIWDVAIQLYGTIEGVFDLLISNPWLTINSDIAAGMELEYHEYFVINPGIVAGVRLNNWVPSNGERHVYYKEIATPMVFICGLPADQEMLEFFISGNGSMVVDWGDNTNLETIKLTSTAQHVTHYFDNVVDERRVRVYGEFNVMLLDTSNIVGDMLTVRPVVVDEFVSHANGNSLKGLFLYTGTVKVDLQKMYIPDLSPIYDMSLQELNLLQVKFSDISVIDNYLTHIVNNYANRRDCTVYLDATPSSIGMEAINTIINEPEWNQSGKWKFIINDVLYTKQ